MSQKTDEFRMSGIDSAERVSFSAVVGCHLFRLLVLGVLLYTYFDFDSVMDLLCADWFLFVQALPILGAFLIFILWPLSRVCYDRCRRGYSVRSTWAPPKSWLREIALCVGGLLFARLFFLCIFEISPKIGRETIDGVTWRCRIVDGNAVITRKHPQGYSAISVTTSGDLTIPAAIDGHPVTGIGEYAFYNCKNLTSITIPDSVRSIKDNAFTNCEGLRSLTLPKDWRWYGKGAFSKCPIKTVYVEKGSVEGCRAFLRRIGVDVSRVDVLERPKTQTTLIALLK